jgi:Sap, sulfolipid-1-addressing protein
MLLEASGLAVLASISPTALLIVAVYLGSASPRRAAAFYLVGALIMSLVMGITILLVLRNAGLSHPGQHGPRYDLRIGLGAALLAAGVLIAKRKRRPADAGGEPQGLLYRMAANPSPRSAFLVGVLVFAPGGAFIAALQVIATARASRELTALAILIVVVINALLVWLPLVLYVIAPGLVLGHLTAFNTRLRAHGRTVLTWVFLVVGGVLVGNGIYGLVS